MFLSNASIKRPVAMACLIIAFTLLGLNSIRKMGLELMPNSDLPFITIVTPYPGASPSEVESDVAKRLEESVGTIDGLKHISSVCMDNVCQTLLEFNMGVDVDIASTDVREKLDLVRSEFPDDVEDPIIQKFDVNSKPIVTLALVGEAPLADIYDYADNEFRDRISVLSGIADLELIGGAEREVHVELDRDKLAGHGLTSMDVVQAIKEGVKLIPAGNIEGGGKEYNVKFDADYNDFKEIETLEIKNSRGRRCRIEDVGRVIMGTDKLRQSARMDGRPCIVARIIKKSDANAAAVVERVKSTLQSELRKDLPGGMDLVWITDDGNFIEATNLSAWINVLEGILLTAAILFFFLYNLQALLVVSITMPLTILIGLFFMQMCGFTLNTSTLVAIGMSVGILVTNSIVVLEAIIKRLNESGDPKEAARLGAQETFTAVLASAGTNIVVLFPLAVMGTLLGTFFKPLALTMLIMTVVSLFLSFSLTPMLCSLLLKPEAKQQKGLLSGMEQRWNKLFKRLQSLYSKILHFNERHRWSAILIILVVLLMLFQSLHLAGSLGFGFFPDMDKGEFFVKLEFPTQNNLSQTRERVNQAIAKLSDLPELEHSLTTVGKVEGVIGQSSEGVYLAQILLRFSERTERKETQEDLLNMIKKRLEGFPGAIKTVSTASVMGGQSAPVEMEISGDNLAKLDQLALYAAEKARQEKGFRDLDTTVRAGKPEVRVRPKRATLADLKIPAVALGMNLRANLEGIAAGTFKEKARNYDIVVQMAEKEGRNQVERLQFPGATGQPIALDTLARTEYRTTPIQITRVDKQRVSKLFSQLDPSLPLGTAIAKLRGIMKEVLPPGYKVHFAGEAEVMGEGQIAMAEAGLTAIVLVFLVLSAILESFKQPFLILATLPLSLIGIIWSLALADASLGMFVIMGTIMLVGIVVNNAILIMDQYNRHISEGVPQHEAMISASCERFRPIIMITVAAVLGMLPLALGRGIGAELRNNIGIAAAGGLLVSGILTLVVIPILYDMFTRNK